jgi:gas vesicle protein
MRNGNNKGSFILGTLIGGIIGGIMALLMAPQSGEETQQVLKEKRDEVIVEAEKRLDQGRVLTEEKFDQARNAIADLIETSRDFLDNASSEIRVEHGNGKSVKKGKTPA